MGNRVVEVLSSLVLTLAAPAVALGADPQAPPTPTPLVARDVAAACPGTSAYTDALVRGAR